MTTPTLRCHVLGEGDVLHLFRGGVLQIDDTRFSLPELGYPALQMIMSGAECWHRSQEDSVLDIRVVTGL